MRRQVANIPVAVRAVEVKITLVLVVPNVIARGRAQRDKGRRLPNDECVQVSLSSCFQPQVISTEGGLGPTAPLPLPHDAGYPFPDIESTTKCADT